MAEKQEFYKLINDKTKVPRLTPIPHIDYLQNERLEKNPLQKFRNHAMKFVKPKPPQTKLTDKWKSSVQRISKTFYTEELIKLAKTITIEGLLPEWEENILKLIPKTSKRKHILFIMAAMKEVRQDYFKEMQNFSVKNIVNTNTTDRDSIVAENCIKCTVQYENLSESFDTKRKHFLKKYFLSHRLVRIIADIMFYNLPQSFINFDEYKNMGELHISKLIDLINKDLQRCSLIVQNQCYNEVVRCMLQTSYLKNDKRLPKLLHCAESFMVQQILNSMMNSINNLIQALECTGNCIKFKLQLLCKNDTLEIEPSVDEIFSSCHQIINNITNIAQDLVPLSEWMKINEDNKYIIVKLPEWFLNKAHDSLHAILKNNFKPLCKHYESLSVRFGALYSNVTKKQIARLIARKKNFETYCLEVDKFNAYLIELHAMIENIYYDFGILNQTCAINDLKQNAIDIIQILVKELVDSHQELNRSICMEFETLESRALTIPDDTKSLFELTDYVAHASKVLVKELETKIERSIEMLCSLIQIATLSNDHIELNKTTINWLELIKPVFSQHNIFCEAKKGELEDELQRKINVLSTEIDAIFPELSIIDDMDDAKGITQYREFLAVILSKIKRIDNQIEWINMEEKLFKFPETTFPKIDEVKEVMSSFCTLIHIIYQWQKDHDVWMDGPFEYLDAKLIENKTSDYLKNITEMHKAFKIKIKSDLTSNKPFKFSGIVDDPDPLQQPTPLKLCWQVLQSINEFKNYVPLAVCMCNTALQKRHWDEMSMIAGINLFPNAGTTLRKIIALNLLKDFEKYEIISMGAKTELELQRKLDTMIEEWDVINFSTVIDSKFDLPVFIDEENINILLEEHFVKVIKMRASYFITPIELKVIDFYNKLCLIRDTVEYWNCVQEECKYLKSLFSNEVVKKHLDTEVDLYNSLNTILKSIENSVSTTPTFDYITKTSSILEKLKQGKYALELINSKVHHYFEQLRISFTRLFFVSDNDIIKLLFEHKSLTENVSSLQKCFPNIAQVKLDEQCNITSIIGEGGEELPLETVISTLPKSESVTNWLISLNKTIADTIKHKIDDSIQLFNNDLNIEWISSNPAIVIFCVWHIFWTSQIHSSFLQLNAEGLKNCRTALKDFKEKAQQFLELKLSTTNREIITSLIILIIHQEEVTNMLIEKKIHEDNDFDWKAQIRYYYQEAQVNVVIINNCIKFAYEFYSSRQRIIVNTPLTERCYRSLMEAHYQNYFGTVVGISCVGKTETIKSLARLLAVPFFIFSGEDGPDYNYIGNIFKGLVTFKTWVYIKNVTRIKEEILSIIAQYIFRISQSRSMESNTINIHGTHLNFNPSCSITFSVNPTLQKLCSIPENLKQYFRTVCFMNPDVEKICQVELFAAGFYDAKNLAVSLTEVFNLCNEQISHEKRINFKLRNLKSIIDTAAKLKCSFPEEEEQVLVLRSLIDLNISQFIEDDIIIFESIINKSFPGVLLPPSNYDNLLKIVETICEKQQLIFHDTFKLKIIQLYEMLYLKRAIILVGDTFSGKSTILRILKEALVSLQEQDNQNNSFKINCKIINPGALSIERIYGFIDKASGKWNDGICSYAMRCFSEDSDSKWKWLIFDGCMHLSWIEKLDTALDESKILCLASNERIVLPQNIQIFFETLNLQNVSPSTLCRCGIVHIDLQTIGWKQILLAEITNASQFQGCENLIYSLFDWSIDPCLEFIRNHCTVILALTDMHIVMSTLNLFKMYMKLAIEENKDKNEKEIKDQIALWSQAAIIMATNWVLVGILDSQSQDKFSDFYINLWNNSNEKYPRPNETKQFEISLPTDSKLEDNIYIFKGAGNWKHYLDILKCEKINDDTLFQEPFVPTIDTIKLSMLFNIHIKYRKPFILHGESSSGKTSFFQNYLASLPKSEYTTNQISFNCLKKSNTAQHFLFSKFNKIKNYNYGPSKNRCCVNVIDDLNSMSDSQSNLNSTLELIRQFMDYGFWYDLNRIKEVTIVNTMFAATLTTGRENLTQLCPRFLRHFNVFAVHTPSKDSMFRIFSNTLLIDLKKNSFTTDVLSSINGIVNATLDVYLAIVQELRPTPSKILYYFSLRDVQRILKGCGLIQKESVETKVTFIRLWAHETFRVMSDRMTDDRDKQWLYTKLKETVKLCFKDPFESVFDYLPKYENNELTKESFNDLAFGNFMDSDKNKRRYEEINSIDNLKSKFQQYIKEYNEINKKTVDIIITNHAVQHLVRICRIFATPGGNALMISSSGSGRKSLIRLAAYIQQQCLFEPIVDMNYDEFCWKRDIKSILMECGTLKKNYTFSVTDRQLKLNFIHDINDLLTLGEIPQLFSVDEQREIIKTVRIDAQKGCKNSEICVRNVFMYFLEQCKQRLHVILNISSIGDTLKVYLQKYPALIDHCTINWFDYWPPEALEQISTQNLKDTNMQESIKNQVIHTSTYFYDKAKKISLQYYEETGKAFHIAPSSFIRSMKLYVDLLTKKQEETKVMRRRYQSGLDKLQLAAREVAQIKNTLTKLRPQLEASAKQTEITMKEIESENISVEKATVLVKKDEEIANKKAEIAGILKAECESELAVAIPILEDAIAALNTLKPTDITLVKAMKNPPDTIKLVMAAVCVMLNVPSERIVDPITGRKSMDFWGPSKRVLGDMNFLQNLKDYDKDNISSTIMTTIKKTYMSDKSFMPHIVAKASSAAEGLCKWVRAMVSYDEVARVVAPKKEKLVAAQKEYDETEAFLNAKRKTLADLNIKLAGLKSTLEATLMKKLELEKEVYDCTVKLKKAESLIASLGGEKTRWLDAANKLGKLYDNLPGDVLLSSAMIIYLSPLSLTYREKSIFEWKNFMKNCSIPFSEEYDFVNFLGIEIKINTWHLSGLSNNKFSLQNAIIMENSPLWCLFIDPQMQANEWIKNIEKTNNLQIVKIGDSDCIDIIRKSIEFGNPVLLENLDEELDITLDPILTRDIYKISETWYMDIGENSVLYKPSFRFYLTTRHHNPRYSVDVFNRVTVTDFLLPSDALRDRLLDIVISRERPELQEKFEKLLVENINNERIIKQQEDNILHILSTSNSNILEDEVAIKTLDTSKTVAIDLMKRQQISKATKEEIDSFRNTYNQFTKYCADLYSTLNILPNLNYMYRFSLSWFTQLYIKSIETSNRSVIHKKRIDYLKMSSIQNLHQSVHNALFEKHKLIYSFILCAKTLLDTEQVTEHEFNVFMNIDEKHFNKFEHETIPNPVSTWLTDKSWKEINKISNSLTVFQSLTSSFVTNSTKWKKYCNSLDYEDCSMPNPWDNKLTAFQKLIVIRIVCPDKIIFKITEFVESVMGQNNSAFIPCNITRPYAESSCFTPLIFLLPSYSSPFSIVNKFATILGYSAKLHSLSMGPSQEKKAELLIEIARKNGEWIFLHNCHLVLPWMMKLEKMCEKFDVSNTSLGFRLWISTQSNDKFPIGILQNSIKIAFDSPYDIKQTLSWTYKTEPVKDKEFFEGCPGKDKAFSKLLYGFCLFHAVIRERKNFGFQSWNFQYEFDETDLQMSIIQLKNWINQCEKVPFKALTYFLGECNYGGKLIDIQDKIYLDSLISDYCNSKIVCDSSYDFDTSNLYRVPKRIEYRDYLKHIRNSIPASPSPEDFCLDKNIALIKNSNKVKDFLNSLSCLNETIVSYDLESRNNQVKSIICETLQILPQDFSIIEIKKKYNISKLEPLNSVLIEEIKLYNNCLNIIRNSLLELRKAYLGYLIWTDKLEELSEEIFQGLVPRSWKSHISLFTQEILSKFIADLLERIKFINDWINNGHPRFYWFGGLMSCKRLLSTLKMIFARKNQVPTDRVAFEFQVLEIRTPTDNYNVPENSIYVYGLYLLGAQWNEQTKSLGCSKSKVFYNTMPVISFELTLKKNVNSVNCYKCPLYVSPNLHNSECNSEMLLDNYILSVNLKSDINPKIWIKRGTALYCQTVN